MDRENNEPNNTMNERPTPETDAAIHKSKKQPYRDFRARELHDFARKLERERDEAREQLKAMRDAIKEAHEALMLAPYRDYETIAKLQPFLA